MRGEPTPAEAKLWEAIRRKQLAGWRFRRQRPIGPYIVDFCCLEQRIVVEVDGEHHRGEDQAGYDAERTAYLEQLGFRVVRLSNAMVMRDLSGALGMIAEAGIKPLSQQQPPFQPSPVRGGRS